MTDTTLRFDTERVVTAPFSGSYQAVGSPTANPSVIATFDNQSNVAVSVSVDGTHVWKTFSAGSAVILDVRANHGQDSEFAIPIGTQFYVLGSGGAGIFSIIQSKRIERSFVLTAGSSVAKPSRATA